MLDPEFAAFEANLGGQAMPELQHPAHFGSGTPTQFPGASHANAGWASDFQNLHISSPSPAQLQRSSVAPPHAGWQNEFLSQQQRTPIHPLQTQPHTTRAFQPSLAPSYPMYHSPINTHQAPQETRSDSLAPAEQFDESAFEAAFEQARADMELHETHASLELGQESGEIDEADTAEAPAEDIRIGSDTIPQTDQQGRQAQIHDADQLAQTAGQLIDNLRHDQSDKFQQSAFLALMRRIRDREVQVEGDEFREVSSNP